MNARTQTRKLAFEQVENREMMAGNVSAAMYGDQLVIQGDNNSNTIEITEIYNRVVEIKATNSTTINGTDKAYFYIPSDKINVFMNGGDDTLTIASTAGRSPTGFENAYIDMGSGRDQLALWGTQMINTTVVMGADWEYDADYLDIGRNPYLANSPMPISGAIWIFALAAAMIILPCVSTQMSMAIRVYEPVLAMTLSASIACMPLGTSLPI